MFEVSFDWQGVDGVAINIECSHSSWSSDAQLASKQKLETSNQVVPAVPETISLSGVARSCTLK